MEDGGRSAKRRATLGSTEDPLAWRTAIVALVGLVAGGAAAWAFGFHAPASLRELHETTTGGHYALDYRLITIDKVAPAALLTVFVLLSGLSAQRGRDALVASLGTGLVAVAAMFLAWAVTGDPVAAGVAMAAVMALTSLAARQPPPIRALGLLLSVVYFYYAAFGFLRKLPALKVLELAAIGFGTAAVLLVLVFLTRRLRGPAIAPDAETESPSQVPPAPVPRVPFLAGGPTMRYAAVRGALIGALMALYATKSAHGTAFAAEHSMFFHAVFWVMLTAWVVLEPAPDATWAKAITRVAGVMAGCLLVAALGQVVPAAWMVTIGFAAVLVGILWIRRNYAVYQASMSFLIVALLGDLHRESFVSWAGRRLLDTMIGVALALGAYYFAVVLPGRRARGTAPTA